MEYTGFVYSMNKGNTLYAYRIWNIKIWMYIFIYDFIETGQYVSVYFVL